MLVSSIAFKTAFIYLTPKIWCLTSFALPVLHVRLRLTADTFSKKLVISLIFTAFDTLQSHSVPKTIRFARDALVGGCLVGPIRGANTGRMIKIINEPFWTSHACQSLIVPNTRIRTRHTKIVVIYVWRIPRTNTLALFLIKDIGRRTSCACLSL